MKTTLVLLLATLAGCAATEQKARAYRDAAERFINPEKIKICYTREGDIAQGVEYRCFGNQCKLPTCPGETTKAQGTAQ